MDAGERITSYDHLIKLSWINNGNDDYVPMLIVWSGSQIKYIPLRIGNYFSVGITQPKICVGYVGTDLNRHPCPAQEKITNGTQCKLCYQLDVNAVCSRCNGTSCDAAPELQSSCINTPTIVYIAGFKSGILKVGVTRESRGLSRWLEQGADYAIRLTTCPDGLRARKIEDYISQTFNITKVVHKSRKKIFGQNSFSFEWFLESINNKFGNVKSLLDCIISLNDVFDLTKYYGDTKFLGLPTEISIPKHIKDEIRLVGNIVAIKGSFIILRNNKSFYLVDLSRAYGYHLNWESNSAMQVQSSLEEFF